MIEDTRSINVVAGLILAAGIVFILVPLVIVVITATQSYEDFLRNDFSLLPGTALLSNIKEVFTTTDLPMQILNSVIVASIAASGKVVFAFLTAFALVFFKTRYQALIYAAVLMSIMLPLELIVITAYQITANVALPINALANRWGFWELMFGSRLDLQFNLLDTYSGIALPMVAHGTAVLILVQFFKTLPRDLAKAAIVDGAGPLRFMVDILLPLAKAPILSVGIYMFIGAWVQYMWPLVAASSPEKIVAVVGLARLGEGNPDAVPNFPIEMTGAILVTLPAIVLIAVFQRQIVRGLTLSEK